MEHEARHVAIFRETLNAFAPRFERRLNAIAETAKPLVVRSEKAAVRRFLKDIQRRTRPLLREMNRVLDREHAKLDTPENYRREQDRCEQ